MPRPGPLVISGFFSETIGIGRAGRLTAQALEAAGYAPERHDLRATFRHIADRKARLPGENSGVWLIHANALEVLVALMAHTPEQWSKRYRIGFWAWETPKAPSDWVWLARYLHEIWVPSQFVYDALAATFAAQGAQDLSARLRLLPHPAPGAAASADRARFGLEAGVCETLSLFDTKSSAARKNPWAAIEAWTKAFPAPSKAHRLTLKVQDLSDDAPTRERLERILATRSDVRLFTERLSDSEMDSFVASFDVLMSLHRSEGFGLSLLEAMRAGVCVIATGWSGNVDFMTPDNARLTGYRLIPIEDRHGAYSIVKREPAQVWAEADTDEAAKALRELCTDAGLRQQLGQEARKVVDQVNAPWSREALAALPFNRFLLNP